VIANARNGSTIPEIAADDVIETACRIQAGQIEALPVGPVPEAMRSLVLAVKAYEGSAIKVAIRDSTRDLRKAMLLYPSIGELEPPADLLKAMRRK
jgi:6-phospho-beta-glucosidase